jgi:Putative zinc-finger
MDCDAYRDQMLDLLYGEAGDSDRRQVEAHQAACPSCREEMAAFRRLRRDLSAWKVPVPARARPVVRLWPGLAAAAALVLGLGGAAVLGGAEVRHDAQGWSFRVGGTAADLHARLDQQEARHRMEIAQLRETPGRPSSSAEGEALLAAVQDLLRESERRQDARLREAMTRLSERHEAQRRFDQAQVSAGLSYLEGKAGLHAARTNELVGQVLLASQEK